jgi:hypothetical protein
MVPGALHSDRSTLHANRQAVDGFLAHWGNGRALKTQASQLPHFLKRGLRSNIVVIEGVPLASVISDLLLFLELKDHRDAEEHSASLIALGAAQTLKPSPVVDIYLMNSTYRSRQAGRGFEAHDIRAPINQYFSNSAGSANDKDHATPGRISLQLRRLDVGHITADRGKADVKDVPWFALHIPTELRKSLQVELRG